MPHPKSTIDLTGKTFGRWLVKSVAHQGPPPHYTRHWNCICECGKEKAVTQGSLTAGKSLSCGCIQVEKLTTRITKHGRCRTVEYRAYRKMRERCENPNNPMYHYYGGRGISVDPRWSTFEPFFADMGLRPSSKHSLERKDNNAGYSPENCVWASQSQQMLNTRQNHLVTYDGRTMPLTLWAKERGLKFATLYARLTRGWDVERALTTGLPVSYR